MTLCSWFVTCGHLAVSRRIQIPAQLRFFSWDAYQTLKKSCCLLPAVSGLGDQLTRCMGGSQFTPPGDLRETKLCLSSVSKADSEHSALFSWDAQDEKQNDRCSQRNLRGGTRRFLVFAQEISSEETDRIRGQEGREAPNSISIKN